MPFEVPASLLPARGKSQSTAEFAPIVSPRRIRWLWVALGVVGFAAAIILLIWSANPLLPGAGLLLAVSAGFLHQRGEYRAMEQTLRDREALIRIVVDGAIDAIMTVDSRGAVASFNLAAERMFGWQPAQIIGRRVDLLLAPEPKGDEPGGGTGQQLALRDNAACGGGREVLARRRDGSSFPIYLTCSETRMDGQGIVTAIARDVTEYRQNAEALQVANATLEIKVVELEERTRVITLLGRMSDRLQAATSPAEAYASIAGYARQLFPSDAGALCSVDPAKNVVEVVATWGETPVTRPLFAPGDCWALRSGRVYAVSGSAGAGTCPHVSGVSAAGNACIPILSQGVPLGTVHLRWNSETVGEVDLANDTTPFRTKLAAAFAEQVGLALTNIRLKELLRTQAFHDPLTGLHNRRFLEEAFQRELLRAARKESPVGVLMLDLDHFKAFNDANGHAAGDALLRAFAVQLQSDIRAEDIACRFGGEEFAVILPDTTLMQAQARAEQIHDGLRKIIIDFQGRRLEGVTVSIGVAALPEHGLSPDALLRAADAALYAAKVDGRDLTRLATQAYAGSAALQPDSSDRARDVGGLGMST
jgi:diguanylate cyclase (GGDEF)-like protein/PAS domain S-box-containing protein